MKIGFLQLRPRFGAVAENVRAAKSLLSDISDAVVVLPELFNTGYVFRSKEELAALAEPVTGGRTVTEMKSLARKQRLTLIFGMAEKKGKKYYNSAVMVTPAGKTYSYQKAHLFDREKLFFTPGDKNFPVHTVDGVRIGMMVCFDWFFPEVARILALRGAQIICHPSNLVLPYCQSAMRTRSLENKVFSVTANRIGTEKRGTVSLTFTGNSQVVNPTGTVLVSAGVRSESLKIVEINLDEANDKTVTPNNDLFKDRNPSLYKPLIQRRV